MWVRRCLTVPAANVAFAQNLCATVAGPSGAGMWITPLSPTGIAPATHYITEGCIQSNFAGLLPLWTIGADGVTRTLVNPGNAAYVAAAATAAGMTTTQTQVQALYDLVDIVDSTSSGPFPNMARMGLKMIVAAV